MSEVAELIAELLNEVWNDGDMIAGPNERDRRAADALATLTARVAELGRERDSAIAENQFAAQTIANVNARADTAEARLAKAVEALRAMTSRFELYVGPDGLHAGRHDAELLDRARAALNGEKP